MNTQVQQIKFKRGTKAALIKKLSQLGGTVLAAGEPAFETDTGQLKIGDGVHSYEYLPYVGNGEGGGGTDTRFVFQDPTDGQVVIYDATLGKWVNKDLADEESIIYLTERGLTIQGYDQAKNGQMLVKDAQRGLVWQDPVSLDAMEVYVANAAASATEAGISATVAGNSASEATRQAGLAEGINKQTIAFLNGKFWWGTAEEYNALESIDAGTFYFIRDEF